MVLNEVKKEKSKISVMSSEDLWGKKKLFSLDHCLNPLITDFAECSKVSCCEICLTSSKTPTEAKLALKKKSASIFAAV